MLFRSRAVICRILDHLGQDRLGPARLIGVGHRVVHGGERFSASVLVNDDVIAAIRSFIPLAPLQNPADLAGIEAVSALRPELPQVAAFDTAFHQTMPARAYRYAVPEEWYTRHGVRRFGFHGTSYRFVSERAAILLEDAWHAVAAAGWALAHADPDPPDRARVAALVHRRLSPPGD